MQKLLEAIRFSKRLRSNLFELEELLSVATVLDEVVAVNRNIKLYSDLVKSWVEDNKPGILMRIEMKSLRQEINSIRRQIASKTSMVLTAQRAA
ncbi:hypothetical protein MMG00_09895 [Ignatzschineria rhizosphaerae]|uniref:Uncharacterized protein n=1 Tax=Ignatzschineria rhizosphaerae TaxID=2923279 RepID=A0ABY3WY41_9GAMM|nr:hypothetical protein [Ignatzschineria rhizosphaerae]UNM95532.1 hypothetical protein MMG00_09895 [Ignatzschineria rhizosphaerae]